MVARIWLNAALLVLLCFAVVPAAQSQIPFEGSDWCFDCHPTQYNDWRVSGHPYKLVPAEDAHVRPIPLPSGIRWDDISYVIGGYKWKSRYMDDQGYIITTVFDEDTGLPIDGMNQYNYMTDKWANYHAGEVGKPYNCGACHTSGWIPDEDAETDDDLSDNQDGLPGIWGTFQVGGIHCEECHGAGIIMEIDDSAEACGSCHFRGDLAGIPASGGFIRHHEQYNEMLHSPHSPDIFPWFKCVTCHDPHKKSEFSIVQACEDCHDDIAASYATTSMGAVGVTCMDCHMAMATKSATPLGPYKGDIQTHLFTINTSKNGKMFTPDGGSVLLDSEGQGAVTLDFACMDCHPDKHMNWLAKNAKNFHQQGLNRPPVKTPQAFAQGGTPSSSRGIRKDDN